MAEQNKQRDAAVFNSKTDKPVQAKQKWSLKKKLYVIGGSLVTLFVVLLIVVTLATSAPVKVSNDLVADIQANNSTAAYALLSSGAQGVTDASTLASTLDRISPILTGKPSMQSKEIKGETGSSAGAKVVYKIHGNDGVDYKLTVNLTKESGDWKVLNFENVKQ